MSLSRIPSFLRVVCACLLAISVVAPASASAADAPRWWKGNLHTHSLWSDGDDFPEMIVGWYKEHGYDFLMLSDHNVLAEGDKWVAMTNAVRKVALEKYVKRYGKDWVQQRDGKGGRTEVRLKTLDEYRPKFEEPGKYLIIKGEEVTTTHLTAAIHMNVTNIRKVIQPQSGDTVLMVMQNTVDAVMAQRKETGQPMIPHLNHPNFRWGITAEELMQVKGERFFEVYNGHPLVNNEGDQTHASTERIWDIVLTRRLAELGMEVMYGLGTDDAHNYHTNAVGHSNTGRGWVMVRTTKLTPEALVEAMEAGDFYASSGVTLKDVQRGPEGLKVEIQPEAGVDYTIQFIGTRRGYDPKNEPVRAANGEALRVTHRYSNDIGVVLSEVKGTSATYKPKGDEIYVRAKVISSKLKTNPYAKGEFEQAWIQPLVLKTGAQ